MKRSLQRRQCSHSSIAVLGRFRVILGLGSLVVLGVCAGLTVYFTLQELRNESAAAEQAFTVRFTPDLPSFDEFFQVNRRALRATADAIDSHHGLPSKDEVATVCCACLHDWTVGRRCLLHSVRLSARRTFLWNLEKSNP